MLSREKVEIFCDFLSFFLAYFTPLKQETLGIELDQWLNNFPVDLNDETESSRTVGSSSSDFPQIQFPDMPLDDLYVGQHIATAEKNMKKQAEKDLEEIRQKVQFLCDVCILVYEGKNPPKSDIEKKNLAAKYHNPAEKINLCSECYGGKNLQTNNFELLSAQKGFQHILTAIFYSVASEEEKRDFCKLSIASCKTDDDAEEYMTFLQDLCARLGIDTES